MSDKKYLNKSMVEFVLDKANKFKYVDNYDIIDYQSDTENYAYALSQTPHLGHFIPCDENDVPIYEPELVDLHSDSCQCKRCENECERYIFEKKLYQQACDRVLFEGMEVKLMSNDVKAVKNGDVHFFWYNLEKTKEWSLSKGVNTFEYLIKFNLPLTEAGANFFGL